MIGFDIWDNKELYHKYPKTNETVLELFLSELYIIFRGRDVDYEISPEQYEDLDEWFVEEYNVTPEMFYDSYHYFEELIKNARFYVDNTGEVVLELSDAPVAREIDNQELDEITWMNLVDDSLAEFEDLTGVSVYTLGRSGRHVCVDLNLKNLICFDDLKDVVEKLQKQLIDDANNANLDESFGYDTSVDDSTMYEINAKFNDDVDFDTKIVDRDELYSFVTKIAEINDDDEPENDIDAIITFLSDYDIYISQPKNEKSKEITLESVFTEPDEVIIFKREVNSADDKEEIQSLIYGLSDGVAEYDCQAAFDEFEESSLDTLKEKVISAIDLYLEDNDWLGYSDLVELASKSSKSSDKVIGKTWADFIQNIESQLGYEVDSADKRKPSQFIDMYKDGKYYVGEITRYYDGTFELMEYNIHDTSAQKTGVGIRLGESNYIQSGTYDVLERPLDSIEDNSWKELASKSVEDSDGFLTDYTLYTDGEHYICMFGDKDIYKPDIDYADYETESKEDAYDWFESYDNDDTEWEMRADRFDDIESPYYNGDLDDDDFDDILESTEVVNSEYSPDLLNELVNYYSSFDTMSSEEIWDEIFNTYHNEALADDVLDSLDGKNTTLEDVNHKSINTTDSIIIDDSILKHSDEFKYQLLSRMQTDCNYFLGAGNRAEKFLWAGNVPEQIAYMRAIYNSFPDNKKPEWISLADIDEYEKKMLKLDESLDIDDELEHPEQEFDSAKTSINSNKLPAVYKMISFPAGSIGVDFGGGSFDNAVEYISDLGATLLVYDPYNRSAEHNRQVIKMLKDNGGADWAVNSNVLNVIKEPDARRAVLKNISKITKPNAPIYITVYEGRGDRKEGSTKAGYQLNRKTQDYLEEIREVFPDAKRKGKLITAHNTKSSTSSINENSENISPDSYAYIKKAILGDQKSIKYLQKQGYNVHKLVNPIQAAEVGTYEITDPATDKAYNYDNTLSYYASKKVNESQSYLDRVEELMEQGLDEETASREAYAEFYPDKYDADDYDEAYSANYGGAYDVDPEQYFTREDLVESADDEYVYAYCDNCGKKNRVKVHFKDYSSPFDDTEFECKYCKGHNLLHDPHLYNDSGEIYGVETNESFDTGKGPYWYFTRHGVQPGSVPKDINILDIVDVDNGSYFLSDKVIDTDNLHEYEIEEKKPDFLESNQKSNKLTRNKLVKLKNEILSVVKDVMMSPNFGFEEDEINEYSVVEVTEKDGSIKVEVRAELDYDGLIELCQALDPVVEKYDKNAYFEPFAPGIIDAYIYN